MDGWHAAQSWIIFAALAGGLGWYYYPKGKKPAAQPAPAKEVKERPKKPARQATYAEKAAVQPESTNVDNTATTTETKASQNGAKKRKATSQLTTPAAPTPKEADDDEIDMSTRHFAEQMRKARDGVKVTKSDKQQERVKTVKPKGATPVLSSGSSQADEDDWSPAVSPALRSSGIDDMLEPVASGPTSLRITAPEKPVKEKVKKAKKEEPAETKKQRQNRQKKEREAAERAEFDKEQKARGEAQRRTARIAEGRSAKDGSQFMASQSANNPWTERNAVRDVQNPVKATAEEQPQLLDTFDAASTSSSNAEASTAATSTTDQAPNNWKDEIASGEDEYQRAIEESERETGWSEVKTSKKSQKKKPSENGDVTPVQQQPVAAAPSKAKPKTNGKPVGKFAALADETDVDPSDTSNWTA